MSKIVGLLALVRTLRSSLFLPDGHLSFPGTDLLPMVNSTEELSFDPTIRDSVKQHGG